jgi:anti-anti-sigma factor
MAFNSAREVSGKIGKITLTGELDASAAPTFRVDIEAAAGAGVKKLVLMMAGLNYMASAGLRALVYAKQKMGADTDIYIVAAQDSIRETLELTGFQTSVVVLDTYDAAAIGG